MLKAGLFPTKVNMDGWKATRNAWKALFTSVVTICCFLHVFIKIRDRAKKKYKDIFDQAATKLWTVIKLKIKLHSLSESEDLSSGAKKIAYHLLLQTL